MIAHIRGGQEMGRAGGLLMGAIVNMAPALYHGVVATRKPAQEFTFLAGLAGLER